MAKKKGRKKKEKPDFHRQTVLFRWALGKLGVVSLAEFKDRFQIDANSQEGYDDRTGLHNFFERIAGALPAAEGGRVLGADRLREYEENILKHTQAVNEARSRHNQPTIAWKYHQYLALLFTEMFLDAFFENPEGLRAEINDTIDEHNDECGQSSPQNRVAPFPTEPTTDDPADAKDQLSRLAFWCATGSGKTLLVHVHIRQFRLYHARAHKAGTWPALDQVILVTPNDGLSHQHKRELTQSGFDVVEIGEQGTDGLFATHARGAVKIVSISKIITDEEIKQRREGGQKFETQGLVTQQMEGCNLVLVDEGHRGAGSGDDGTWIKRRDQLAKTGFTFEYSATFKEAIGNDEEMRDRYARCTLIDYSYQSFYRDGYGKDFSILNLEDDENRTRYLTMALLLFYQQLRVWADGGEAIKPFRIDKPLWVFVGHTVTGGISTNDDRASVSDVVEVLLFFREFLNDTPESTAMIRSLLEDGFKDSHGRDLLANKLTHLDTSGNKASLAKAIHVGILRDVFNAPNGGTLAVQLLKDATGELALKVGDHEPFGVVNVGEPGAVADACEKQGILKLEDDAYRPSLFKDINRDDSPINLLVGSRKFTEGWNSWRVSSIGLMRMGRGEGTQIIQLFGRGVRLRGYGMSLRRSSAMSPQDMPRPPKGLRLVETLQVFGVKATYMERFKEWIFSELPETQDRQIWELPVVKKLPERKLKTLRLREEIDGHNLKGKGAERYAFKALGPIVILRPPTNSDEDTWLRNNRARLNWMPRIRGIVSEKDEITDALGEAEDLPIQKLSEIPLMFFDVDALLFGLEAHKASKGLDRLHVDRDAIVALLESHEWYVLHATDDAMRLDRWENRSQWQRMAQQLLNSYAERFYKFVRSRWEAPYLEVREVEEADESIIDSYTIETTDRVKDATDAERIEGLFEDLKKALKMDPLADQSYLNAKWRTVPFGGHLYQPLLYVGKNLEVRILPVALNDGEATFVEDLAKWCLANTGHEVYLLRNMAMRGLGFFQASNFYPDFLLWIQDKDTQHLAFVDPKGLSYHNPYDAKLRFPTREIPRLQSTLDSSSEELRLHSYIISSTSYAKLDWHQDGGTMMSKQAIESLGVFFQEDDATTYVARMMEQILGGGLVAVGGLGM